MYHVVHRSHSYDDCAKGIVITMDNEIENILLIKVNMIPSIQTGMTMNRVLNDSINIYTYFIIKKLISISISDRINKIN